MRGLVTTGPAVDPEQIESAGRGDGGALGTASRGARPRRRAGDSRRPRHGGEGPRGRCPDRVHAHRPGPAGQRRPRSPIEAPGSRSPEARRRPRWRRRCSRCSMIRPTVARGPARRAAPRRGRERCRPGRAGGARPPHHLASICRRSRSVVLTARAASAPPANAHVSSAGARTGSRGVTRGPSTVVAAAHAAGVQVDDRDLVRRLDQRAGRELEDGALRVRLARVDVAADSTTTGPPAGHALSAALPRWSGRPRT